MKKLLTLLALTISFSMNAQISTSGTNNSGNVASAMGLATTASGEASTAMGYYSIASGQGSTAMGLGTLASGQGSTAMGYGAIASGPVSTAIGVNTTANGSYSTVSGYYSTASGQGSTAMGNITAAIGDYSTAIGFSQGEEYTPGESTPFYKNEALGNYSVVLGNRNKSTGIKSFSIGNDNLSQGTATFSIGENNISTGDYSMAIGLFSESIGKSSFAFGNNAYADGFNTTAIGVANTIDENASPDVWSMNNRLLVVGNGQYDEETQTLERSDAFTIMFNGDATLAGELTASAFIGDGSQLTNISSGPFSFNEDMQTAIQSPWSTASGNYSNAFGNNNIASGYAALAMGSFSEAIGQNSVTIGGSTKAIGNFSTAIGNTTVAEDLGTTAIGYWNSLDETPNPYDFSLQNTAFVIGNGGFDSDGNYIGTDESRSDAFVVKFSGDATLAGNLSVNSDAKLKSNIISLGSTLAKVLMLDGKSYSMKNDPQNLVKIGLVAQDIEQAFPELVSESNGIKSVNYQGLIPVLINAVKEQDEIIKKQDERLAKLEQVIAKMNE